MQRVRGGAFLKKEYITGITILTVFLLDRLTKFAINAHLKTGEFVEVIPGFFNIVHTRNTGIAFGMFSGGGMFFTLLFIGVSVVAIGVLFYLLKDAVSGLQVFGLSLIIGGALGNLVDRVLFGEVVDFLDFYVGSYHWPAFNVADSAITGGVLIALVELHRR